MKTDEIESTVAVSIHRKAADDTCRANVAKTPRLYRQAARMNRGTSMLALKTYLRLA
ncbi:hypothetical protein PAMC26577_21015 [Caballeronia sordidicola]|uniref:Uncharacterized protein n=1 Tax=Caballeronia sordidicola TaxID=196367 RepID=A0A242MMW0_CABSO|nr:hypothetical protein PAMC26577_21015 [Caballeronia sordidicola]